VEQQKQWGILFCHILILRIPIECWKKKNTRKRNEDNVMDGSQMFEFLDGRWYSTCMARQKRTATPPEEEKKARRNTLTHSAPGRVSVCVRI
jgi:hypothetical protein